METEAQCHYSNGHYKEDDCIDFWVIKQELRYDTITGY
jgi:hypothetical protein